MLNRVRALTLGIFSSKNKKEVVSKHLAAIDNTNKSQFRSQMKASGFSPADTEPWISNYNFETPSVDRNIKYTVKEGDKIHEITTRFNISVGKLLAANDLTSLKLTTNQELVIK